MNQKNINPPEKVVIADSIIDDSSKISAAAAGIYLLSDGNYNNQPPFNMENNRDYFIGCLAELIYELNSRIFARLSCKIPPGTTAKDIPGMLEKEVPA
jgi:hypothetical protein